MKALVRRLYGAALCSALLLYALAERGGRLLTARRPPSTAPQRVLVLRFGLLGDGTALLSPTLRQLRETFPGARVDVLATPLQRPLLEGLPEVDRVLTWSAGDLTEPRQALRPAAWGAARAALREIRRERYSLALSCYGRLASAVALLSGASRRIGYRDEAFPHSLTGTLPGKRYDRPGWHEADYGVALVDFAAGRQGHQGQPSGAVPPGPPLRLRVSPE
ncbi:MAG TPA: hypothetical protein VH257_23280, partial [Chloroflexota bacterium]|nr:hypothetical protein [Chloroflexota bacterium]